MASRGYTLVAGVLLGLFVFMGYRMLSDGDTRSRITEGQRVGQTVNSGTRYVLEQVSQAQNEPRKTAPSVSVESREETLRGETSEDVEGSDHGNTPFGNPHVNDQGESVPMGTSDVNPVRYVIGTSVDPDSWTPPTLPEDLASKDQKDPALARHIRDHWILPPFTGERMLNQPDQVHYSQRGQSAYIDKLLKQKTGGFYIECGAANGEGLSNSLFFEKSRNWSGILIEANPSYFSQIVKLRRHAYMLHACLSPTPKPGLLDFRLAGYIGGLVKNMEESHKQRVFRQTGKHTEENLIKIQCFPLVAILRALNVTHVDYFSLDIEGAEYEILKDFPFDEIQVDVLTIEYVVSGGGGATSQKLKSIKDLMIGRYGYRKTSYKGAEDIMLAKKPWSIT